MILLNVATKGSKRTTTKILNFLYIEHPHPEGKFTPGRLKYNYCSF